MIRLNNGTTIDLPDQFDFMTIPHTGTRSALAMFHAAGYQIVHFNSMSPEGKVVYFAHIHEGLVPTRFSVTTIRLHSDWLASCMKNGMPFAYETLRSSNVSSFA